MIAKPNKNAGQSPGDKEPHATMVDADTLRLERVLPGPIELVWAYLTESEKRGKWLASGDMDLRVGGKANLFFDHKNLSHEKEPLERYKDVAGGHHFTGKITRCESPSLLSYTWDEDQEHPSEVTFELSPQGNEVLMVLTHRRIKDKKDALGFAAGWHAHVGILVDNLHNRTPRGFWSYFDNLEAEYKKRFPLE